MHQRQPGFIEQQIRRQIASPQWQEDFGRLLFQLMVPQDFKEAARALDGVVLVVDSYTANLPWELMLADEMQNRAGEKKPLAVRMRVVRQLATGRYRPGRALARAAHGAGDRQSRRSTASTSSSARPAAGSSRTRRPSCTPRRKPKPWPRCWAAWATRWKR